jgi:sirohydrochlorin cobaltochelatase
MSAKLEFSGLKKKAILVISFGTTYENTRKLTIEKIEKLIEENYKDYEIRRAFTAHGVIKKLASKYQMHVDTPEEALNRLKEEGFSQIIVQPLHLIPGLEYDYVRNVIDSFSKEDCFESIKLGRPLLYFKGEEEDIPDDYTLMIEALENQVPRDEAVVFMGHGTHHPANSTYSCLQTVFWDNDFHKVFIGTIDGYPTLDHVIKKLKKNNITKLTLMPLLLVAGDHAQNDMAGEEEDSWKNILQREGFEVDIYLHGLGENLNIQKLYLEHLEDAISEKYSNIGKNKKGMASNF